MLLTLEALDASEGDCLLLLYGTARRPRLMAIDGGPRATCGRTLLPRLLELRAASPRPDAPLPLELLVVTHVDSDHIAGVVALTGRLRELQQRNAELPITIRELWHNSFDSVLDEQQVARAIEFVNNLPTVDGAGAGEVASIGEGRRLYDDATALGVAINLEFGDLVARADDAAVEVPCGDGLRLTVLGPARQQLEAFRQEWEAAMRKAPAAAGQVTSTVSLDTSRPNLASIVLLAECGGRSLLLAGDARGDHILAGLEAAGRLQPGGTVHVDVFKLPHHGSCRNNTSELLERVVADTYVISANGKHGNPDRETLERLAAARGDACYTVVCTFPEAAYRHVVEDAPDADERRAALQSFHEWARAMTARGVKFVYRDPDALAVSVVLGDERTP